MTVFPLRALVMALSLVFAGAAHAQPANAKPPLDSRAGPTPSAAAAEDAAARARRQPGDHIAVVVNQDVVTAGEITVRAERAREEARMRGDASLDALTAREQAKEALIEDRVLVTYARDSGARVDEAELDRVVANVAAQNRLSLDQLKQRLQEDGIDFKRFRENMRDQMLIERIREREVIGRIRVTDGEIDQLLADRAAQAARNAPLNVAQILVTVPADATEPDRQARRQRAEQALARVRSGEDFAKVAAEISEDANRTKGGEVGLRPADRLPDLFVQGAEGLKSGEVLGRLLISEAGYHVLKLVERKEAGSSPNQITETRARHILLRPSEKLSPELALQRLKEFKRAIESGRATFEDLAKQHSEDGSAPQGGDLGWAAPGMFVPEFEEVMNRLDANMLSEPLQSRFGMHLIQVLERRTKEVDARQLRDQARGQLRERKFEEAYKEWVKDLRARAFIEMRDGAN
ncbi:peptidylprolyl isomerase [Inhella gelatinilytica]|uniref:Chaperone SurA n=1 Tax=Inhella gelatinilytica TaxID=2795030 RepID=A0A931IVH5_9BURK|nr:peptidylprolyl isomerase [Inhella gelatinilytica]MBH9551744.1 peptidylprolyl isomerase [Inhella gelatinilytica]